MFLKTLENCADKFKNYNPAKLFSATRLALRAALKKTKLKSELLTDTDMLSMFEKVSRGGLYHSFNPNKYGLFEDIFLWAGVNLTLSLCFKKN